MSKIAFSAARPLLPYLKHLPTPLLSLAPSLFLFGAGNGSHSPWAYLTAPTTHPLHPPILLTTALIPLIYTLGLLSGNISWVDRLWPFYTPIHSLLIGLWATYNASAGIYAHNLPRLYLMIFLQFCWSARLTRHAIRRGFYDLTGQDYRYSAVQKAIPVWAFQLIHFFAVAIFQPILLFSLSLPLHSILVMPPSELSAGPIPALSIPNAALPFGQSTMTATPVLNLSDFVLTILSFLILYVEFTADETQYEFQEAKHSSKSKDIVTPTRILNSKLPQPAAYPRQFHPGFVTSGLFKWSRHPNFAAEQLFWLTQALFVVGAGESSGVTRSGWLGGSVFAPAFGLSLLFCGSTRLTEWITTRRFPAYRTYSQLVGQFLPQETFILWLWNSFRSHQTWKDLQRPPKA